MLDALLFSASAVAVLLLSKRHPEHQQTLDADERICLVTADNQVLPDGGRRADMRAQNLWHRATYLLVFCGDKVLVQKRSLLKDYCPGKYDPTPGGVVGYQESYLENAQRELAEEMGISNVPLKRLFTFSFQDERVRVWGDFYECHFYGSPEDLVLQKEEVDSVQAWSLETLHQRITDSPQDFMPDACHALRLYFQRKLDQKVNRRLIKGYSSADLDDYDLRPKPQVIFFDCDDCLYFDDWNTANKLTDKIDEWCVQQHDLPTGHAYKLYKKYGTALKGLLAEKFLSEDRIDEFLQAVHDIPLLFPGPDYELREMIMKMDPDIPKYIFTASVRQHAERCLEKLGIADLFVDIIDVKSCNLETKHSSHAFSRAMEIASVDDPESCLLLDDNLKNLRAAREMGWRAVQVGRYGRDCGSLQQSEHAELDMDRIHEVQKVLPELFTKEDAVLVN